MQVGSTPLPSSPVSVDSSQRRSEPEKRNSFFPFSFLFSHFTLTMTLSRGLEKGYNGHFIATRVQIFLKELGPGFCGWNITVIL